jgi:hypothetical protein
VFYGAQLGEKNNSKIRRFLSKCQLIVVKASPKTQTIGNSKPCQRCIKFLQKTGIKKIYYSVSPEEIVMEKITHIKNDHLSSKYRNPWSQQKK